jgi:hypothetical protein
MTFKISKILLPTTTAFVAFVGLIELEDKFHNQIFTVDSNFNSGPQIDSTFLLLIALTLPYLFCIFFQGLIVVPFWTKINCRKKMLELNLWQIVGLITLIIFILIFLISLLKGYEIKLLLLNCFIFLLMFIVYCLLDSEFPNTKND